MTRKLQLRYLWIDALCIIQGPSRDDWNAEAPRMADIYSHSFANITTLWAEEPRAGFLDTGVSDPPFVSKVKFARAGLALSDHILLDLDVWEDLVSNAPLNKRGWVLQEAILAPRQIYFTKSHIFWECRETMRLDIFPRCFPLGVKRRPDIFELEDYKNAKPHDLDDVWMTLLEQYSQRSLTYVADKLVAIAGLARKFHILRFDDEYVAGVWRSDLLNSLLWRTLRPLETSHLRLPLTAGEQGYRAPSWSWAQTPNISLYFRDRFSVGQEVTLVKILDVQIKNWPENSYYGYVESGNLLLRGILTPVICRLTNERNKPYDLLTCDQSSSVADLISFDTVPAVGRSTNDVSTQELFCLPVLAFALPGLVALEGLILVQRRQGSRDGKPPQLSRIGVFISYNRREARKLGIESEPFSFTPRPQYRITNLDESTWQTVELV